jgi:hypothetical protein
MTLPLVAMLRVLEVLDAPVVPSWRLHNRRRALVLASQSRCAVAVTTFGPSSQSSTAFRLASWTSANSKGNPAIESGPHEQIELHRDVFAGR